MIEIMTGKTGAAEQVYHFEFIAIRAREREGKEDLIRLG